MSRISIEKRLPKYHKIYEQIYEDPSIPLYQIMKNTGISRSTVSRYLIEMYGLSILKGPLIFVKPAQNYHQYAAFLKFEHPLRAYQGFKGFPSLYSRSVLVGAWNIMVVCEKFMNFSSLKGFRDCLLHEAKGVTYVPKVASFDWDTSLEKMYSSLFHPRGKSSLYHEIPHNHWEKEEWTLATRFKHNIRTHAMPILKESGIRFEKYQKWFSSLRAYAHMYTAFYPYGLDQYFVFDFLFRTEHQKQLVDILGMLPSSSLFFSVDSYLLARLSLLNKKEKDELFSFILDLGEEGYFTDFHCASVVSTSYL
ncbi:MAG: winged helix-turn-helix domain-containing protein [Theionarchaea archaeon]|nr:winged helix-turn-helix domain-containing protein [Theionarchaea archaeon]